MNKTKIKKYISKWGPRLELEVRSRVNYKIAASFLKKHAQPRLNSSEKTEIDEYWSQFGIKFPDYSWYEMFYGVTGIHSPKFIPDTLATYICYPYYNIRSHVGGWDDKNVYERLVPSATFPYSICHCINGNLYDNLYIYYSHDSIDSLVEKIYESIEKEAIYKETCNTSQGRGVKKIHFTSPADVKDLLYNRKSKNWILQKKIVQHPFFNQFCSTSANIIRIISWRDLRGAIHILSASVRFGIEGSFTDVAFVNGEEIVNVVGINENGFINDRYVRFDGKFYPNIEVKEKAIPSWEKLIECVKKAHSELFFFNFVAWDYMIDDTGTPICIEYNIDRPGTILYQFANGPLAGEQTDSFLSFLLEIDRSRIPTFFRK